MQNLEAQIAEAIQAESQAIIEVYDEARQDADRVLRLIRKLDLEPDARLLLIVAEPVAQLLEEPKPGPIQPPEPEKVGGILAKPQSPAMQAKVERQKQAALKRTQRIAERVTDALANGPLNRYALTKAAGFGNENQTARGLKYLMDQGKVKMRKELKYQGTMLYYRVNIPVSLQDLENHVRATTRKDEAIDETLVMEDLGFDSVNSVQIMLRRLAKSGSITKRGGFYFVERPLVNPKNGRGKNANFSGSQVATSGNKISSNKTVNEIVKKAKALGAEVKTTGDHIQVRTELGTATIAHTPSESGLKQDKMNLKRIGLNV